MANRKERKASDSVRNKFAAAYNFVEKHWDAATFDDFTNALADADELRDKHNYDVPFDLLMQAAYMFVESEYHKRMEKA